jgi:hypothetical protein
MPLNTSGLEVYTPAISHVRSMQALDRQHCSTTNKTRVIRQQRTNQALAGQISVHDAVLTSMTRAPYWIYIAISCTLTPHIAIGSDPQLTSTSL